MRLELVPQRECGPCNVCCAQPTLPVLRKLPGTLCPHWAPEACCTIYETRPDSCRGHMCGWRMMAELDESWRPDQSKVYVRVMTGPPTDFLDQVPSGSQYVDLAIVGDVTDMYLIKLAAFAAALVAEDIPVFLTAPAPPEHLRRRFPLNGPLKPFAAMDPAVFVEAFKMAFDAATAMPVVKVRFDENNRPVPVLP